MSVAVTLSQLSCRRDELARAYKSRIWCAIKTRQRLKEATLFDSIHLSDINELLGTSVSEPHLTVGDLYRMERGMEDGARMVVWEGIKTNKPGVSLIAEYPNAIYLFFIPSQKSGHFYLVFLLAASYLQQGAAVCTRPWAWLDLSSRGGLASHA